ncbi:MAG: UDP-N-acetylmuramoyl-L-alanyl-D-glutamate--2,6-diaminopimelate ligase [Gammaproteobacteria bacterium WSBS_2016_MAG_OTU1]
MFDAATVIKKLDVPVCRLCCDSRQLQRGDIFLAYGGHKTDGRNYIAAAVAAGAGGVLWESDKFTFPAEIQIPNVGVSSLSAHAGLLADFVYNKPSEKLFVSAITGTNGKSTVAHFAAQLFLQSGKTAGIVGTLGAGLAGQKLQPVVNTTPDAITLHGHMRDFVAANVKAALIEASSHGIAQKRLTGMHVAAAVLTNIGRDHLDYHGDWDNYRQTKSELLQLPGLQTAIVNTDDAACAEIAAQHQGADLWTFGKEAKTLRLIAVDAVSQNSGGGQKLTLDGEDGRRQVVLNAPGMHNVQNFMAAALIARAGGVSWEEMRPQELTLPVGRLQRVNPGQSPAVYVDYAHTPDALSAAMTALQNREGRLWLVFGCGGSRDEGKRRMMGKMATRADVAIITDDNPRHEKAADIRAEILSGGLNLLEIPGRGEAIAAAIEKSAAADTVLIAGKGHEEYQEIGDERRHFSDVEVAQVMLTIRNRSDIGRC